MNTELKPGMMALIIGCVKSPENIGKVVELISYIKKGRQEFKRACNECGQLGNKRR